MYIAVASIPNFGAFRRINHKHDLELIELLKRYRALKDSKAPAYKKSDNLHKQNMHL